MAFPSLADIMANNAVNPEADSAPAPDNSAPAQSTTPEEVPVEAVQDESTPDVSEEASAESQVDDARNPIPYDRFKEKVDQTNQLKENNELLMQRLQLLESQVQGQDETTPEPELDPILQRLESLDEYASEDDLKDVIKDMAGELAELRKQSSNSSQSVQDMRVQSQVKAIENEIATHAETASVHDKAAARIFVLESMSRDPNLEVNELVQGFAQWERDQEEVILKRLGMSRPEAKAKAETPDVPPRPATVSGSSPSKGSATAAPEAGMTLKEMRQKLLSSKRRRR
jgi:uncharacterized protein (UPF0147 family)